MKRFVPWLAVIIALLIIAAVLRQCRNGGAANYQTAMITRGPVTQAVTATGTLNPVINVQVGSQVSGNIAKLSADFNSQVKAGQVVAQIDPALFQATVTQAEGDLANAQATLELARVNGKRTQELFAKKTSSQADVDQAMATLHQSEATVPRALHYYFTDRRCSHFAQCRCWSDGCSQSPSPHHLCDCE